jgi:putative DNA primase/helicase
MEALAMNPIQGNGNTPPRPVALVPIPENIPARLKARRQWTVCRLEWTGTRWTKVPYQPNGRKASSTNAATWSTFAEVWTAYQAGSWDGIEYALTADDGLVGIDIDHCVDAGRVNAQGQYIAERFATYAERSISGTGIRLFAEGTLPAKGRNKKGNTELYATQRFLTVTGHRLEGAPATIEPRAKVITAFHAEVFGRPKPERPRVAYQSQPVNLDDQALLAKARGAKNGAKFSRAYDGDSSDWKGDASDGDLYLAGELLWWTDGDRARAMRLFEASGRMRDKWHEQHGQFTYGERTFNLACDRFRGGYRPSAPVPTLESVPDNLSATPAPEPVAVAGAACSTCPYTDRLAQLEAETAALQARVAKLETANEHLRARMKDLHATHLQTLDTQRDPRLKLAANTAVAVAKEVASQVSRGADKDGWVRVTLAPHSKAPGRSLAEQAGRSDRRVSADLDQFEKAGWLKRRYDAERTQRVDPATGEITTQTITVLRVKIEGAEDGAPALLTKLRAKYDERDAKAAEGDDTAKTKKWGGARPRCPDHPKAALVERREVCCAQCGKVLEFKERPYHPGELEESPVDQAERPDLWPELTPTTPARQLDGHTSVPPTAADDMPPERGNHANSPTTCPPRDQLAEAAALEDAPRLVVLPGGGDDDDLPELGGLYRAVLEADEEEPPPRDWRASPARCVCGVGLRPGETSCGNRFCREAVAMAGGAE